MLKYFLGVVFFLVTLSCSAVAEESPFAKAEKLEIAGESLSAQIEYSVILEKLINKDNFGASGDLEMGMTDFLLEKILELSKFTGENKEALAVIQKVLATKKLMPVVQDRYRWGEITLLLRLNKVNEAKKISAELGMIRDWFFPNNAGTDNPLSTRIMSPDAYADFSVFGGSEDEGQIQVSTIIKSSTAQPAALRFGVNVPLKIILNSSQVLSEKITGDAGFDQKAVGVNLLKGDNVLTFILQSPESDAEGEVGLYARLTDVSGKKIDNITIAPAKIKGDAEYQEKMLRLIDERSETIEDDKSLTPVDIAGGGAKILASMLKNNSDNALVAYYLGYILSRRMNLGAHSTAAQQLLFQAARQDPRNGMYFLAAATASAQSSRLRPDRDENMSRMALEKALSINESNVIALCTLGEYYLNSMLSPDNARKYIDRALKINPTSPHANLILFSIYVARGWKAKAVKIAEQTSKREPQIPAVQYMQSMAQLEYGEISLAVSALKRAVNADITNRKYVGELFSILVRTAKINEAKKLAKDYLAIFPYDLPFSVNYVSMLLSTSGDSSKSDLKEAEKILEHLQQVNPNNSEVVKLVAEVAARNGDKKAAMKNYEKSLSLNPADSQLRSFLAFKGITAESPLTEIVDLGEYVSQFADLKFPSDADQGYILTEECDELSVGGTRRNTVHLVAKILSQEGANSARRIPIWFDSDTEIVRVNKSRVLHSDGTSGVAQVVPVPRPGERQVNLVVFPALSRGDVIELEYSVLQIKPNFFGTYFGHIQRFKRTYPVHISRYILSTPKDLQLYFHKSKDAPEAKVTTDDGKVTRVWQMQDLPGFEMSPLMPPLNEMSPVVQISTFKDWDELARWYWGLIRNQNVATAEIKDLVKELTAGAETDREKVAAIYDWVITNVRNNAWEFGVHGYKPYNAHAIFTRKFGDCKDKATLINVMAREIGLEAWPVLLWATEPSDTVAGRGNEDLTLPLLSHFNHCISAIDIDGQTLYLDGTMTYRTIQSEPLTDSAAAAVIVRPEGAKVTKLPDYAPEKNLWNEDLQMVLREGGIVDMTFAIKTSGQASMFFRSWFRNPLTWNNVMRSICTSKYGHVSAVNVNDFVDIGVGADMAELDARVRIRDYVKEQNDALVLKIPTSLLAGEFGRSGAVPQSMVAFAPSSTRNVDVVLPALFKVERVIDIEWEDGYEIAENLKPINIDSDFGTLKVDYSQGGNTLEIKYSLILKKARIPVKDYQAFRRFCLQADLVDKMSITLEKVNE